MIYDLIIIGSGPAGLMASIYASRYKLSNLVVGKMVGGTITYAHKVDNFPGLSGLSGVELSQKIATQAKDLGAEIITESVEEIKGDRGNKGEMVFKVFTESGKEFEAKSLIVATGTERRKLGVPGEEEYLSKGVSYCTTCDIPFFKNKTVVIVGGNDGACSGATHAANFADKVYLVYRKNALRAEPFWVEEIKNNPKIEVIYEANIIKITGGQEGVGGAKGQGRVTAVELDKPYNGETILKTDGVFVEIGGEPQIDFLKELPVETTETGYIKVSDRMETNVKGIFGAGDITDKGLILPQVITACAQGAIAANSAFEYLKSSK